jgi:hypothetical protein
MHIGKGKYSTFGPQLSIPQATQNAWQFRYCGHTELVKGIVKLKEFSGYASCSWDRTLRIWRSHVKPPELLEHHAWAVKAHDPFAKRVAPTGVSDFEKSNPRFIPPSLMVRHSDSPTEI